jgi:hypothetical protein
MQVEQREQREHGNGGSTLPKEQQHARRDEGERPSHRMSNSAKG